jgi:hypothetical protein
MDTSWGSWLTAAKTLLDIFKGLKAEFPKGSKADEVQTQIELAEDALQKSEAELAKNLGYQLCKCTFPPQIMLWNKYAKANVLSTLRRSKLSENRV